MARAIAVPLRRPRELPAAALLPLLVAAALLASCASAPVRPEAAGVAPPPSLAAMASPTSPLLPSDAGAVPPHSGTSVYEAVQPDPSNMPRDLLLVLYPDRVAILLDRVVGDPAMPLRRWEGSWSLSDAGTVIVDLEGEGGSLRLPLKRGEGYLTGDGTRFGGGVMLLREI